MSEIVHPPVDLDLLSPNSVEQTFAQEAAILLMDCSIELEEIVDSKLVTTQVTERIDMDSSTSGLTVALRLRSLPVLTGVSLDLDECVKSEERIVIALEHASYDSYEDEIDDDGELDWKPYVLAVLNIYNPDDIQVLDAATGQNLSNGDLMTAQVVLSKLREELRDARFEESDLQSYLGATSRALPSGPDYVEFESGEFIDTNPCTDPCPNEHFSCSHSPYSLN